MDVESLIEWLHSYRSATLVADSADAVQRITRSAAIELIKWSKAEIKEAQPTNPIGRI